MKNWPKFEKWAECSGRFGRVLSGRIRGGRGGVGVLTVSGIKTTRKGRRRKLIWTETFWGLFAKFIVMRLRIKEWKCEAAVILSVTETINLFSSSSSFPLPPTLPSFPQLFVPSYSELRLTTTVNIILLLLPPTIPPPYFYHCLPFL